jgi:hypothetical protein
LPPHWTQKVSYDGRIYYHNLVSEKTTWNVDNINQDTGDLYSADDVPQSQRSSFIASNAPMSWNSLSDDIIAAIHNLNVSAKNGLNDMFISQSSIVVEAIRVMLYASGTARKDAPAVASHKNLKANHRQIMNSLSKLVLSSKLASGANPPSDAVAKMQNCCHEVLLSVRHFVAAAIEAEISISYAQDGGTLGADSLVSHNEHGTEHDSAHQLASTLTMGADLVTYLERYTRSVVKMISSLMRSIREDQCSSQKLIQDVRSMVTEVGNFLAAVDEMPIDTLTDELSVDFKVNRLALYNSISGLVMATQTATSPLAPANALEQVVLCTGLVEKAVKDLLISTKFLIEEKESIDSHQLESDDLVKPRRTVSLSALAPPTLTPIPESELAIRTPAVRHHLNESSAPPKSAGPLGPPRNEPEVEKTAGTKTRDKLKKFFGESISSSSLQVTPLPLTPSKEVPRVWYLEYDYDSADLQFTAEGGNVKGGTIVALVERLTLHDSFSIITILTI